MTHWSFNETGRAKAEEIVQLIQEKGAPARIDKTYWDYGAGITWDTIITAVQGGAIDGMEFQLLYPAEHDRMNEGTMEDSEVQEIIQRIFK